MNSIIFTFNLPSKGSNSRSVLTWAILVKSFMAVQSLTLVTANMMLSVFVISGAGAACDKESHLLITTPQRMEALSGSCLHIPCTFNASSELSSTQTTIGIWIKNDSNINLHPGNEIFNSNKMDNIYPMKITGDLRQKNCTTLFSSLILSYNDIYFFRMENRPFLATAVCDPRLIQVKDSPPSPRIEISGDLREKESVTISCSAATPCPLYPPQLSWTLQQNPEHIRTENTNRTFTTKIQKTFTLSDEHDGFNITCSASYPVNEGADHKTAEETKTLSVPYAPKNTSASVSPSSGLVSAGSWVKLSCSSRAKPPVSSFTWFKKSNDGAVNVSGGDLYSFNVTDGGVYYCVATNDLGEQPSSEIHLTIIGGISTLQVGAIIGGIIGLIILMCLVVCIWYLKSTHPTQTQSPPGEELAVKEPATKAEEDIHYGEIDFSKQKPERPAASAQDGGRQQETLYAEVNVPKTANGSTATDGEALYAQVKKT